MNSVAIEKARVGRRLFFVIMASAVIALRSPALRQHSIFAVPFLKIARRLFCCTSTIVFSAWVIVFLVQSILIARGSRRLHQRLD